MIRSNKETKGIVPCILVSNDEYWLPYTLACASGHFHKYVIYNIGSKDATNQIIEEFIEEEQKKADIVYRCLPMVPKEAQGPYRNSMIAESGSDWYFILDGDEVYSEKGIQGIKDSYWEMQREYEFNGIIYGLVSRIEVCDDLETSWGAGITLPHHRIYHRTATWAGPHPGERAVIKQVDFREKWLDDRVECYHFHNCRRSTTENTALERKNRKAQDTYRRGSIGECDVMEKLPILHTITKYPTHPVLKEKQCKLGQNANVDK